MITAKVITNLRGLDKIDREVPKRVESKVTDVARYIVSDVTSSFYQGAAPSPVGGPPAIVTGELRDSAKIEPARDRRGRFSYGKVIKYDTDYAGALETADYNPSRYRYNRPFLQAAVERAESMFLMGWEGIFR